MAETQTQTQTRTTTVQGAQGGQGGRGGEVRDFLLPDVGEGLTEAEIVRWHVQPGDHVEVNQTIVEIETAKAIVELPCPYEGVITALHADEGQTIDVGVPIISVDVSGGAGTGAGAGGAAVVSGEGAVVSGEGAATATTAGAAPPAAPAPTWENALQEEMVPAAHEPGGGETDAAQEPKRTPVLVGYGVKPGTTKRRPRKAGVGAPVRPSAHPQPVDNGAAAPPMDRPLAKPPVRKLARALGVDLGTVRGTGANGVITRQDVTRAAETLSRPDQGTGMPSPFEDGPGATAAASATFPAGTAAGLEERIPVKGVRKQTATSMVASAFTAPHVTEFLQVDVTQTMRAVRRLRELPEFAEVKVTPLLLVAKALLVAVRRHPMINSSWDGDEIVLKRYVNLGIAAATERGLIVPNIKNAQELPLAELAAQMGRLVETARTGRTALADLTGGTISITNVGVFGVDTGTPILPPGEAAILAFGQVREIPWVHKGKIKARQVTTLALSFDHRIVDGELGSKVLRDVGAALQDPLRLVAWS